MANSTMWPMWLIAEKSLLQLSGTLQTRFSQRNFNRATQVPSGSHSKGHTVHHYSHITSLLPSTMWPVWLIAEKSLLQLFGTLQTRFNQGNFNRDTQEVPSGSHSKDHTVHHYSHITSLFIILDPRREKVL